MRSFKGSGGFRRPGKTWQHDTSRDVTTVIEARNSVAAILAVLATIDFDERAEQVHFIVVGEPEA